MRKITLNTIRKHQPCADGWNTLLKSLGETKASNKRVSFIQILESNGIEDAIWCLRCIPYKEKCLFLADVAESVLPIFEAKYPDDKRPRQTIETIRKYKLGKATITEVRKSAAAYAASDAAAYAAAYAASGAASDAASDAADDAAYAAAYTAAAYAASDAAVAARKAKWNEIKQLFIKHFS